MGARLLVPVLLTLLIFGLAHLWRPQLVDHLLTLPLSYAIFAAAGVVVIFAAGVRIWTGSDLAAFIAEAAFPAAALTLCLTVAVQPS